MLTLQQAYDYTSGMEGKELWAYFDTKGFKTVGVGCNMDAVGCKDLFKALGIDYVKVYNKVIPLTEEQSMNLFKATFDDRMSKLPKVVVNFSELSDNRQLALFDLSMAGMKVVSQFHDMLIAIRIEDWNAAAYHLLDSKWAKDVKSHRANSDAELLRKG